MTKRTKTPPPDVPLALLAAATFCASYTDGEHLTRDHVRALLRDVLAEADPSTEIELPSYTDEFYGALADDTQREHLLAIACEAFNHAEDNFVRGLVWGYRLFAGGGR